MNTNDIIKSMITKFGEDSQIDVTIEEMSELTKELIKYKRGKIHPEEKTATNRKNVIEELGDVAFMMEYLKIIFQITNNELAETIHVKALRTKERYLDEKSRNK